MVASWRVCRTHDFCSCSSNPILVMCSAMMSVIASRICSCLYRVQKSATTRAGSSPANTSSGCRPSAVSMLKARSGTRAGAGTSAGVSSAAGVGAAAAARDSGAGFSTGLGTAAAMAA